MAVQGQTPAMYRGQQIVGAGRGLVADRLIRAGEVVLSEAPLILTPSQELCSSVCANCLRFVQGKPCKQLQPQPQISADILAYLQLRAV